MQACAHRFLDPPSPAPDGMTLLLESTSEGVYGIDNTGACTFINRAGARLLGWPVEDLVGRNMHAVTHHSHADGHDYPECDCPIFQAFRLGQPCRVDAEVFWRRDGSSFPVEYSSSPIIDQGQVHGAVITFVDITERRALADALQRANERLAQTNEMLETQVRQRTAALSAALAQVRELAAHAESVREQERTRIAREVHDELGSLLVALKMDVNWFEKRLREQDGRTPEDAHRVRDHLRGKCRHMSHLIEDAVASVGRIITDLRPSVLDHQGLWAALEWHAHEFLPAAELSLDWRMEVPGGLVLPEAQAIAVFRIFQEMLSNVVRHAQAAQVRISIEAHADALSIQVSDDGRGAEPQVFEAHDAYGVMGMRERAGHFGGAIEIRSMPGEGSTFSLHWPLEHHG
ncbi:MAG: PAS domain S-box protein [Ottowia sp.]|uniref:sensor histidine kinase n=1 Tax=Ottowia sp. TaxID=1898956 RepID=UPI003C72785A